MRNVPHLRFPEFTEGWEEVTLKEVADFQKDRVSTELLNESTYISTENIQQNFGGIQLANTVPTNANVIAYNKNDILLSNIRPYLKKVWLADRNGGCSADVFVLRSRCCEQSFLYNVIASDRFIGYVMSGAKGVKMPRGDKKQMENFKFSLPSVIEQRKISRLLSLLDERIATQNKIIEKLQSLIKGIYDKILWQGYKQTSLSGILDERNERTTINNQYQVLSSTAKGLYRQSDYFDKEVASVNNIGYKVLRLGDIVLSPQNLWLGNINYNDAFEIGIVSPSYKVFSIREDYNPYFVSCFLKTPKALYEYANASEQGASIVRRNLDINAFMAICFPMPDRIMQDKVSERLRAINMKFDIEKQILEKLNIEKQYLLRQMFI